MIRPERPSGPRQGSRAWRPTRASIAGLTAFLALSTLVLVVAPRPSSAGTTTWSVASGPTVGNQLNGVSCQASARCVAVGYLVTAQGVRHTLAQSTSGTTWTIMPTPNRGSRDNALAAVACASTQRCVAVGTSDSGTGPVTLIESWDGTTWTTTPSPNPSANGNQLAGVACPATTRCIAVGSVNTAGHLQTLVETWTGTTWTTTPSPSPSTSRDATLNSVACVSTTWCVAVGSSVSTAGHLQTLVETWDGTAWTVTPSPSPSVTADAILTGVSCTGTTSCAAVGNSDNGVGFHRTLINTWNGTTWLANTSRDPSPSGNYLRGISCWRSGQCVAVGWFGFDGSTSTLVETSTGTTWAISKTPVTGGDSNELSATSCDSNTHCVAVGRTANGNAEHTLAFDGSTLADVTPPSISTSSPTDGGYYVVGQTLRAHYTCPDEVGGSGTATCVGPATSGAAIDTSSAGPRQFSVSATDFAGNSAGATASYTVVDPVSTSSTAPPGGASITTDPGGGPTPQIPVATTLTSSNQGDLSINQNAVTLIPPAGLDLLGIQIETAAPTPTSTPLRLTFDLDAALAPSTTVDSLAVLKDATSVPDCPGATTLPAGVDACVSARAAAPSGGGDVRLTALAATAGQWNLATGTAAPPQVNVGNASAVETNSGTTLLQVPVSLSEPSALALNVSYATADRTARAGSDYISKTGVLDFRPGQTVGAVLVTVNGDAVHESNETFAVTLSSPSGATLGDADGIETIVDNDPIAPAAPTVQAVASTAQATLSWTLPANNGSPITAYRVLVYDNGVLQTSRSHTITCTQPCTPARDWTVTGLTNGKQYEFTVAAQNVKGFGPAGTTTVSVIDISNGALLPGRPAAPKATAGTGKVTLSWTPPLNGTATITSYTLTPYKGGTLQPAITVGQDVRSYVFTKLTAGATYTFTVAPTSLVGLGPDSAKSNSVNAS